MVISHGPLTLDLGLFCKVKISEKDIQSSCYCSNLKFSHKQRRIIEMTLFCPCLYNVGVCFKSIYIDIQILTPRPCLPHVKLMLTS